MSKSESNAATEQRETQSTLTTTVTHNASPQVNVVRNNDPALDTANEYRHTTHTHHAESALKNRTHEPVYTIGTTDEPSVIPHQDRQDHNLHRRAVAGEKLDASRSVPVRETDTKSPYVVDVDTEKATATPLSHVSSETDPQSHRWARLYSRFKPLVHITIFLLFTGWWIAGLILNRYTLGWVVPFLVWLAITVRLITFYIPISVIFRPMNYLWRQTGVRVSNAIPEKLRIPAGAAVAISVFIIGAFASPENLDNTRANRAVSLFGFVVVLFGLWVTSRNRKMIPWKTVIVGMLSQFIIALFVLRSGAGYDIFHFIAQLAVDLLGFSHNGFIFLFGSEVAAIPSFAVSVLPAILFFVAFVQILYYFGILQWFIVKAAVFFFWAMNVSGAEAVVAAASPFIGQGENVMLIRPFIAHLTMAEIHQVMCSGFATISGSVLIAYIGLGISPQALVSSCVMSIPASLAISKMRWPETEETLTAGRCVIPEDEEKRSANVLHAFAQGAWLGLKIAGIIGSTLLCILALVALVDGLLTWWGHYLNIYNPDLTLELILGYLFYPIAFLLGVSRDGNDIYLVARLIGEKVITNEFVAYTDLSSNPIYTGLSPRSQVIATYALCGFGNIGSLGNQVGILSQLAPGRSGDVSRVALSALISGILSTMTSASIAGLLLTDQQTQ